MACATSGESAASGERVLLDPVIPIDRFNGIDATTGYLRGMAPLTNISSVTGTEERTGFDEADLPLPRALLDALPLIVIDRDVADHAAVLRRTNRWRLPDALQVTVAGVPWSNQHPIGQPGRISSDGPPSGAIIGSTLKTQGKRRRGGHDGPAEAPRGGVHAVPGGADRG